MKRDIFLGTLIALLACFFLAGVWYYRNQFIEALKRYILKWQQEKPILASEELMDDPLIAPARFDVEKAIAAIAIEEKKYAKLQTIKEPYKKSEAENNGKLMPTLEDADVYIAYERYGQAEKVLQNILQHEPEHFAAFLKLLELYVLTEKYDEFKKYYAAMPRDLKNISPAIWSKIELLLEKVESENIKEVSFKKVAESATHTFASHEASVPSQSKKAVLTLEKIESDPPKEINPENPESQLSLAQAFIDIGDFESARELLLKVLTEGQAEQKQKAQQLLAKLEKS